MRLFLDIQTRFASSVMTRVIERILLGTFKGPVVKNSLLMRMSADRLFDVLQSNMVCLVPKVLRALQYRLDMYVRVLRVCVCLCIFVQCSCVITIVQDSRVLRCKC